MRSAALLPTFVCVGPGRTGTTWLYEVLRAHPEVALAEGIKETEFFDLNYGRGLVWYEGFFRSAGAASAVGEITNRYIFDPEVVERIWQAIPAGKIIIGIRNPYDRLVSNYSFKLREGSYRGAFEQAIRDMPALLEESRISKFAAPYVERFGRENVFFLVFDDIAEQPAALCMRLFKFLGVDQTFVPPMHDRQINQAIVPRHLWLGRLTKAFGRSLRTLGMYRLLTSLKRSDFIKKLFFKRFDKKAVDWYQGAVGAVVDPIFTEEIGALEVLVGRDLQRWKRNASGEAKRVLS